MAQVAPKASMCEPSALVRIPSVNIISIDVKRQFLIRMRLKNIVSRELWILLN